MDSIGLQLREILSLDDDLLLPWLDLYETAFPAVERVLISSQIRLLKARMAGEPSDHHIVAAVNGDGDLTGMLQYHMLPQVSAAFLWYFAIQPGTRSKGLGTQMYREMQQLLDPTSCRAIIYEVEIPGDAPSEEQRQLAERRIAFYRRLGARVLRGIHYVQNVGWHQPPIPMHVIIHPSQAMDAQTAFELAKSVFEDSITQIGAIALE